MNKLLQIQDLEVEIAPFGASDAVTGPQCAVALGVIMILVYIWS